MFKQLIECVDPGASDYSFFNPTRLANWKGPTAWKTGAMAKSHKYRKQSNVTFKNTYSTSLFCNSCNEHLIFVIKCFCNIMACRTTAKK